MNEKQMLEFAKGIAPPFAKELHARSLANVGTILYLSEKGIIDLNDYLNFMNELKEGLMQSDDYEQGTKEAIQAEFDFYRERLIG